MKRILIVNVNWLGDTLFVTPFIRVVREKFPTSYIAILTHPRCQEVLEGSPHIDEIIIYDEKHTHRHLFGKFSLIAELRAKKFDTAFILRKSLTRTMLLFLSKIPQRIGYDSKRAGFLLTKKIPPPQANLHRVEYFLGIARHMGINTKNVDYEFFVSIEDKNRAIEALKEAGISKGEDFIVMNAGGNWDLKRWPLENFARLGDGIFDRFRTKVVLAGAKKDIGLSEKIYDLMKYKPILICGKTDLKALASIFEKAKMVISNDSGPLHIASALRTPVIGIFGPTSPNITGPYGNSKRKVLWRDVGCKVPCYNLKCKDNKCMKAVSVEDVIKAVGELI